MDGKMKKGFTLAEVLITLAIIGVVAALTIPTVIHNYKKQVTVERLKTAYATFSKIIQTAEAEKGSISSWYSENDIIKNPTAERRRPILDNFANTYIIPYANVVESGRKPLKDHGYKNGILRPGGVVAASAESEAMGVLLANGMFIYIGSGNHGNPNNPNDIQNQWLTCFRFYVDLDGPKGANTVGYDIFVFSKTFSSNPGFSKLVMEGLYTSEYFDDTNSYKNINFNTREALLNGCRNTGTFCGALIMKDGWKISDDYPWL